MAQLSFKPGVKVNYNNSPAVIIKIVDLDLITIQMLESNIVHTIKTNKVEPHIESSDIKKDIPIDALTEKEWLLAKKRYDILKPILNNKTNSDYIKNIAKANNIHFTTLYRWIKIYNKTKTISSLCGSKRLGGKNKSRLDSISNDIINNTITDLYLDPSKKSISKIIRAITIKCKDKDITPPHPNTIRNRIKNLSEEEVLRKRYGKSKARDKFEPIRSEFPGANYPLSVVQIDHTCVDIILVDEHYRKAFRRPYLTLAIDVYSRMVVGLHLSFDPPGAMGTGLCIANAILAKEMILEKHGINGEWPCWGTMATIHLDNAKEFRGEMLKRACQNYAINIEHRPVATPHWGGHVERLLGTFAKEIHNLPGTTFSKISERENYNSQAKASLTINEFEKWLLTYIINVYHKKNHSTINMPPLEKYRQGIFGKKGIGVPPKLLNERKVRLDFMPFVERTIQEYGVVIDHIYYYDEVLKRYIHSKENQSKNSRKRKFIFKRDPRDISIIYFYDTELNEYFEVPYRDTSKPPISIWEFNEVVNKLQKDNIPIDEDSIFIAYKNMEEIELKSIRETKRLKRFSRYSDKRNEKVHLKNMKKNDPKEEKPILTRQETEILPFEDIDDEAFTS
ncbi:Mu transposase C-terminal domain-containing protein [Aquimarina sp. Aq78]|uniref:Mu transposase C-terminal domain-containing protein n=1 Tax=Aquimarina sp. Aq78 TaxID=1191889 RepID=UPI000D0F3501|nr:Mu transposase C-terminal domain-containing protein [Aquimarina sp. Aq78]